MFAVSVPTGKSKDELGFGHLVVVRDVPSAKATPQPSPAEIWYAWRWG